MTAEQVHQAVDICPDRVRVTANRIHLFTNGLVCSYSKDEIINILLRTIQQHKKE